MISQCNGNHSRNLSLSRRIGEYISPYPFYPISELIDLFPGSSRGAIVPEDAYGIGESISPYLFNPISELTDQCPGSSLGAIVPEDAYGIGEYISPYLFNPISELTDQCPGSSLGAIVPEDAYGIGEYISPYLFNPISELTDQCPGSSLGAIVPEGAHAIEDLIVGVDAPHSGLAVGDLLQTARDILPDDAVHVAGGDALAVEDFVVGVDSPHIAFETDGDVLQFPVHVLPSGTRGTEGRVRQKRKENVHSFHVYDL